MSNEFLEGFLDIVREERHTTEEDAREILEARGIPAIGSYLKGVKEAEFYLNDLEKEKETRIEH